MQLRRNVSLLFAASALVLACSSGSGGGGTKNCETASSLQDLKILGSDEDGACGSSDDCNPITCTCTDGNTVDSIKSCVNGSCNGKSQCMSFCADHGGVKSSGPSTGAGSGTGTGGGTGNGTGGAAGTSQAPCSMADASTDA